MKSECLTKPGVAGAVVPGVRRALLVVELHPRDQVEEPEISTFIFPHPLPPLDILMKASEIYELQSASNPITWGPPALAVQGSGRRGSKAGESLTLPNPRPPLHWK